MSGSDISERWARFLKANDEKLSSPSANAVIEDYVARNPSDIVSTLLMLTSYDASANALRADSVMSTINPDVRPGHLVDGFNTMLQRLVASTATEAVSPIPGINMRDSLVEINPADRPLTLIVISDNKGPGRSDSIVPALKRLGRKALRPSLQIADISVDRDTTAWHNSVRTDSASWKRIWVAGSLASPGIERLGVPQLPYFIVSDSTGSQLLRTPSVGRAEAFVDSCINSKH